MAVIGRRCLQGSARVLVHDYAGHPFQVQLSRELARRGHRVRHAYCASLTTTPRGALTPQPDDPDTFDIEGIALDEPLDKNNFLKRWLQERTYGSLVADAVQRFRPDVVLSGNTPLDAQRRLWGACEKVGARKVFWVQDLIGVASERLLRQKVPVVGALIGKYYAWMERRLLHASDAVVAVTEDFLPLLNQWRLPSERATTIENWAPLDEVPTCPQDNAWSREHGLAGKTVFLYSGTLGMKHNPDLLLALAERYRERDVRVVVVSQGLGADYLREHQKARSLTNLMLLPFQPFNRLPEVLASAEVLLAVLEPDAGVFSVPSKVLTYFCARRPVLLAVPPENLAARLVRRLGAGITVLPTNIDAFLDAAERLLEDPSLRRDAAHRARTYAEHAFDIQRITDRFEAVLLA